MRKIQPEKFLLSQNPYEVMLAPVVGKSSEKPKIVQKVVSKLRELAKSKKESIKYIEEANLIARLFDVKVEREMRLLEIIEDTFLFKEGEGKGWREAILVDVKVKFGKEKVEVVRKKIEKIDNVRKLKSLHAKILKARSWNEVLKAINKAKNTKKKKF